MQGMSIVALDGRSDGRQRLQILLRIQAMFDQAESRGIRARNQALIREGGEQGRAAVLNCFEAGITAYGLSWKEFPMTCCTTATRCRVRIVNDIDDRTSVVESPRDRSLVIFDLMRMVKVTNRRRDEVLKVSLHLLPDLIVLHFHCPNYNDDLAKAVLEAARPLHEVEKLLWIIWKGGQQA
jgi:hypothetical protein